MRSDQVVCRGGAMGSERKVLLVLASLVAVIAPSAASAPPECGEPSAVLLATAPEGALGSTIGPGGALYITEPAAGRMSRVDPETGEITTFASGLPTGGGGVFDVAFIGNT